MAKKRVSFGISSDPDTVEGRLLDYLRNNKMLNLRDSVIRALKAYYLPWAYEKQVSPEEAKVLARTAIDELEFRIFQIRRHFLAGEPYGPKLGEMLHPSHGARNEVAMPSTRNGSAVKNSAQPSPATALPDPTSVPEMLERTDIDPDLLDDF